MEQTLLDIAANTWGPQPLGWPSRLSQLIQEETTAEGHASAAAYCRALMRLAAEKGVNLP